jgi:predicted ATPase
MDNNQINVKLKNIRAVKSANIILDGITVIAGENGSGKSTISKLTYNLLKTSIEFDKIVNGKLNEELKSIYRTLDQLTRDLSYFLEKDEYLKVRNSFRRIYRNESQLSIFEDDNSIISSINYLIDKFEEISNLKNKSQLSRRVDRIKRIISDSLSSEHIDEDEKITDLLEKLKKVVTNSIEKSSKLKESRPISILNDTLDDAFYDSSLPNTFNLYEYGIPIIDRTNKKLIPIHSIENVAYIDTPMIMGIDFYSERSHWEDLNKLLLNKSINKSNKEIDFIFSEEVLKGDVKIDEQDISDKTFLYKRNDGEEFDLLECATGLKSFAILQLLYKNGFLNSKTLLVIDEPEAHLHPQWVVEYARLIVLLHKKLGVKFLIASHHPDMISAIKYISEKEQTSKDLHFYLAKLKSGFSYEYTDLGVEIEEIFSSFNIALKRIDLYGETD